MAKNKTGVSHSATPKTGSVVRVDEQSAKRIPLTKLERAARREYNQSIRVAASGNFNNASSVSINSADSAFYSPQLSTDFLELPQSEREKRELFRFWYSTHAIVGAAIDFHTDVPMSKIRLSLPNGKDLKRNKQILHFYESMSKRTRLFQTLYDATHEYWLHGNCMIFCEDHDMTDEIPEELLKTTEEEEVGEIDYAGRSVKKVEKKIIEKSESEQSKAIREYVAKNYEGWKRLQILPPEQVKLEVFQYTNKVKMELIPSEKDRMVVLKAQDQHDAEASKIADDIPDAIRENLLSGQPIPLNTSPYDDFLCSSFCYHLAHKKSAYDDRGISMLERCHLPGTEVTARRDGQICQISIENLNPETDEVLGGSGQWRKFETGSRPYSGPIVGIQVSKLSNTIWSTPDHKMQVLRGDDLVDVEANQVVAGDYIKIAQAKPESMIKSIDLFEFFKNEKWQFHCRRTDLKLPLSITPKESGECLILQYDYTDKNPQRENQRVILKQVADWISSLNSPVEIQSSAFIEKFGISSNSVYRRVINSLEELGYDVPVIKLETQYKFTGRVFKPAIIDTDRLYNISSCLTCPKTIDLDDELGYLIGYYLGDGWTESSKPSATKYGPTGICWKQESTNSQNSIDHIIVKLNNLELCHQEYDYELGWLHIHDDWFSRWIGRNFGHNKSDKHLPDWILNSPSEFKTGILRGLIDSDGWVSISKSISANISMTTKNLIDQLFLIATSIGLNPSIKKRIKSHPVKQANGTFCVNPKTLYSLVFSDRPSLVKIVNSGFIAKLDSIKEKNSQFANGGVLTKFINNELFYEIDSVQIQDTYDGQVHSLNVYEDHSFYTFFAFTKNCLRTLLFQDKLRQAQTSIASRAMTPKRVIWADKMSAIDTDDLRDQVDQALVDPDFSIITNFEVHWDEIGSRDRLLDLGTEYEITNKMLCIGLRITESMLTGESTYSGERIHLDVMNTMYLLYRECLCEFVEQYLFAPVAEKKGFVEEDEYGNRVLIYPKLQFTRLALRDNSELQDFMFNLYQKGSMPIDYIYELLNIDSNDAHERLKKDLFTVKDSAFNELVKTVLNKIGEELPDTTNVRDKILKDLGLTSVAKEGDRFGGE